MWKQQDQILLTWLQSSLSTSKLCRVLGCVHEYEIWDKIHAYFHHQTQTKARQLQSELRHTYLENQLVLEYLGKIKMIVDVLFQLVMLQPIVSTWTPFLKVFPGISILLLFS